MGPQSNGGLEKGMELSGREERRKHQQSYSEPSDVECEGGCWVAGGVHSEGTGLGNHAGLPGFPTLTPAPPFSSVALLPICLSMVISTSLSYLCHDLVLTIFHPDVWPLNPQSPIWKSSWYPHPHSQLGSTSSHWFSCCLHPKPDPHSWTQVAPMPGFQPTGPPLWCCQITWFLRTSQPQTCHAAIYASQLQLTREFSAYYKVSCRCYFWVLNTVAMPWS